MTKKAFIIFFAIVLVFSFSFYLSVQASETTGTLNTGIQSGLGSMDGVVIATPTASPAASTYTSAQSVSLTAAGSTAMCYTTNGDTPACATPTTCTTGTVYSSAVSIASSSTLKTLSCYTDGSASSVGSHAYTINISSGGGGGGGSTTFCSSVTYSNWGTCTGGFQSRNVSSRAPSNCTLSTVQQLATQQNCTATATPEAATTSTTPETTTTTSTTDQNVQAITSESQVVSSGVINSLLSNTGQTRNQEQETSGMSKYTDKIVGTTEIEATEKEAMNNFIVYGTATTKKLGAGERAGVVNSYKSAFGKLPKTESEWSDAIKIANGRWPSETNATSETNAEASFKKIYLRDPDRANPHDDAAVVVMAYGLRPADRNLDSEKAAIKSFEYIYNYSPSSATDWDIVRAIAYSGATR